MQRYFSNQLVDSNFILSDDDWYHIKKVMRMDNDSLIEVVYKQELYIANINEKGATLKEKKETSKASAKKVILAVPLLKEQKMALILQKATELGVSEIIPIITERSIIKLDNKSKLNKLDRWSRICKEASEQSKRVTIPIISNVINIEELEIDGLKIVCSTRNKDNTIKNVLKNNSNYDTIIIVIGPEGGLSSKEEEILISKGFIPTTLGNLIMRVETVPIYVLSVLNYEEM